LVPLTGTVATIAVVDVALHTVWAAGLKLIVGVGLTVIVSVCIAPTQVFAEGVTLIIDVTGTKLLLTAVKAGTLPAPAATNDVLMLLFSHV